MSFHPTHGETDDPHVWTEQDLAELREEAKDRNGLYEKFAVFKRDDGKIVGDPLDDVFVLRPEHDVHALEALATYARSVGYEQSTRRLARDLGTWIDAIKQRRAAVEAEVRSEKKQSGGAK